MNKFDITAWMADLERIYGTAGRVADELEITAAAVSHWRKKGMIPIERQLQLNMLHPRVFTRERLAPNALPPRLRRRDTPAAAA